MIRRQHNPYAKEDITANLHPLVKEWFFSQFQDYSPPQRYSILNIHRRKNTLISSPTGSGKTLSAFLAIINELVTRAEAGTLEDRVYAVYISPLKALGNDIQRNLLTPLKELKELAKKNNTKLNIRVGVRTGDTTPSQKASMLKRPPHILITTPESLGIMITTTKFRDHLRLIDWCVVDEIHALAENKRGVHLSLTLERLEHVTPGYCRVALSATVSPLEEVAKFLVGHDGDNWRDCSVVDVNELKKLDLQVISPVRNIIREEYEAVMDSTYKIIDGLVQQHKTTLIFTNTRSATERVVHHLKERFPKHYAEIDEKTSMPASLIAAHHGSLSKSHRLMVEERLKAGELKVVVSSTSLELGIDIGSIDLVILLGSPKSVARALQRIGRSGHQLHEESKGRIIVQDRDDLVECAVLLKAALEGKIDKIAIPRGALDVLAQQLLGIAIEEKRAVKEVWDLVRKSYCYTDLERKDFDALLDYLSGEYVSLEHRNVYAKIWQDKETGMMGKKGKLTRLIYMTNIGTIPDETNIKVKMGDALIGMISEPFLERLHKGDIFVLGGETYEFRHAQGLTAFVRSASGKKPTVPSWYSEMLPLSFDLSEEINRFRTYMHHHLAAKKSKKDIMAFINSYLYVDSWGATSIYEYFLEQYRYAELPTSKKLLIEHYDDGRNKYVLFHALYGRRTNDVLARAVAYAISKLHRRDVEFMINDNGFAIRTTTTVQAGRALRLLRSDELRAVAERSLDKTEVLARRFRHCAARSLMILRTYKGRKKSVGKQQLSSRLLLSSVKRLDPDFVILKEARREVLEDLMDVHHAEEVVRRIESREVMLKEIMTDVPSPFAFNLILTGYSDILKMQDRQAFLRKMHELVLAKISLGTDAPKDLLAQAGQNPSFAYEEYWREKERHATLTDEEKTDQLLKDLKTASIKTRLDSQVYYDLQQLIARRNERGLPNEQLHAYREETVTFLEELLRGSVPKVWTDGLVKAFREALPGLRWKGRDR
ncbi:ATP-dependent helicase [Candidatus Woesearchaeota archaeon]|nr:ATP-dependent helicase [Candidatus Woesearchaeota archaeon]